MRAGVKLTGLFSPNKKESFDHIKILNYEKGVLTFNLFLIKEEAGIQSVHDKF